MKKSLLTAIVAMASCTPMFGQAPAGGRAAAPPRPVLWVSTDDFPDGGEVPMKNAGRGENKSPEFVFHWNLGTNPTTPPEALKTYAIVFHDIENSSNKTTADTLHWTAFNIPGTTKTLAGGLATGDLPDGTRNGPGINQMRGQAAGYFGPGAGPGPFHHYVWEFYALDTKLDLPPTATRDELMKAMDGHIIGKAAYVGRFHGQPAK